MNTIHVIINKNEGGDKMGVYMTETGSLFPDDANFFIEEKMDEYFEEHKCFTNTIVPLEVFISYNNHRVKFKNIGYIFLTYERKLRDASTDFVTSYILEWKEV